MRIATPYKHPNSGIYYFRRAVPNACRHLLNRAIIKESLHTREPHTARRLFAIKQQECEKLFELARSGCINVISDQLNVNATKLVIGATLQELFDKFNTENKPSVKRFDESQKIYEACEGDAQLIEKVINNLWLKKLASTFKIAHKHLVGDTKVIKNAVGIEREIKTKAKAMAHILQGYERLILDVLITNSEPNDVALLVHDCIVYYTPKSTAELSRIVKESKGFNLEFSKKQY